jgi:hypothetical protein
MTCPYVCVSGIHFVVFVGTSALEYFKKAHDGRAYNLVHYWRVLKDFEKWRLTYASYNKCLKNGKAPLPST